MRLTELPFSPLFDFVWTREVTLNGETVPAGAPVDKTQIDERRLRVLFQTRKIRPAGFEDGVKPGFLELGKGKADQLAAELAIEEGSSETEGEGDDPDASVQAEEGGADAEKPAPAAEKASAKKVDKSKPAARGRVRQRAAA